MKKLFPKLSITANLMLLSIAGVCFVLLLLGLIVIYLIYHFEAPFAYTLGIIIGGAHSALKVILLERTLNKSVELASAQAKLYVQLQSFGRIILTAAFLLSAFLFSAVGLFGVVFGILSLQLSAYVTSIILKKQNIEINQ